MSKKIRRNHHKERHIVHQIESYESSQDRRKTKEIYKPKDLLKRYRDDISSMVEHYDSQRKANKEKGTNIPKFIINMFLRSYPFDLQQQHLTRLDSYRTLEGRTRTRFDLEELFGLCSRDRVKNLQNSLNRAALLRILNNNYENILTNQHIVNKKTYLLFCKKLIFRLRKPHLFDRLEVC